MKASLLSATAWVAVLGSGFTGCQQSPRAATQATAAAGFDGARSVAINTTHLVSGHATLTAKAIAPGEMAYSVCAQVSDWERPVTADHVRQLEAIPRYGKTIHQDPLRSLLDDFRSFSVISFTTYGLSARTEPLYLSGVWTALEEMETCYGEGQPARIESGDLGEAWLLGYAANNLTWADGTYQLSVEPAQGLQVLQFERQEDAATLPLQVVATDGATVPVHSGDYSGSW